ncbi:MAG: hypothetical protein ACE5JO_07045, partial [Candidatus Binatia bacterium]
RAVGWNVIPVAKQAANSGHVRRVALDFIEQNFYSLRNNPDIYHHATLLKSRSTSEKEAKDFIRGLDIPPPEKEGESKFLFQMWYPRIWDEWARDKDNVECCEIEARAAQYDLSSQEDEIRLRTLDPEFIKRFGGHGEGRFANAIELRSYGTKEILAEIIPESDKSLVRAIGGLGFREWRFSKKGMVYLSGHSNWPVHLSLPKAEDVFLQWLKTQTWSAELSTPGRLAKQLVVQLGGIWGISLLANEGIIKLLEKMAEGKEERPGGKTIKKQAFWGEISQIANQEKFIKDPTRILQRLIDVQMFQLGVEIQCPICRRHSWYSIKDADYELQCLNCNGRFQIPSHSPREIEWSYRTFGPFSLPKQASGVYSVLLTLRFFSQLLHGGTTPIMSFRAKKNGKEIEADLGLFFQELRFGSPKTELIFAECKTYNKFQKDDAEKMRYLADQFPGAVLVFATLRDSLSKKEKKLLRPIVNRGRRYWKAERPFNPVLILTGIELFSDLGPPECWKDAGGVHADFGKRFWVRDLLELCDNTQQLYLDMNPWHEWLRERWERRRIV